MQILLILHTATLILLPTYLIRFIFFGLPLTVLEILILLSFLSTVIYVYKKKLSISSFKTSFDLPILFFLASGVLSVFITPDIRGGLGILKAYIIEPILFYYSLVFLAREYKSYRFILYGLIGAVVLVGGLGFLQKTTGMFIFAEHEAAQGRISSFYNSANSVALLIGPVIPLIAILAIQTKKRLFKFLGFGLLVFLTIIMFWTKSRGGLISEIGVLCLLVYGLLSLKILYLRKLVLLIPVLFLVSSTLFFWQIHNLYAPHISEAGVRIEHDTLQIRYATWISTWDLLQERMLFGTGLNGFKPTYQEYKLSDFSEDFQYPHMLVFNFWTEMGLFGLISFFLLICSCLFALWKLFTQKHILLSLGLIGSFAYILIHGLVDVPFFKNDLSLQFFGLVALTQLMKDFANKVKS